MLFIRQIKGISWCNRLISTSCRNYNISTNSRIVGNNFVPAAFLIHQNDSTSQYQLTLKTHGKISIEIGIKKPIWKKEINELPLTNKIIESPNVITNKVIEDFLNIDKTINLPTDSTNANNIKQAARLIVIRKRKMRKHKLRKLRKKMKFVWAKAKQRREWKKEKRFLNGLLNQIKEAQKFSAEDYVNGMIRKATENPPPRYYKSRRMPTWLILEILEKEKAKQVERKYKFWEECGKQ